MPWNVSSGIAQTQMKKSARQSRKQTLDPSDHIAAGAMDNSGTVGPDNDQDLAQLVWKYFGEEIGEALTDVQQALATEQSAL
jgi:hypothetical protein